MSEEEELSSFTTIEYNDNDNNMKPCIKKKKYQDIQSPGFLFIILFAALVVTITFVIMMKRQRQRRNNNDAYDGYNEISRHPCLVMVFRLFAFIHCAIIVCIILSSMATKCGWENVCFFTVWNWMMVYIYFFVAMLTSICDVHCGGNRQENRTRRRLYVALQLVGEIEVPMSLLVTIVTWGFLGPYYNWNPKLDWFGFLNFSMHANNAIYMVIDFFLCSSYTINPGHVALPIIWGAIYVVFHVILNSTTGMIVYPFFATDDILVIPFGVMLFAVIILFFYALYGIGGRIKKRMKVYTMDNLNNITSSRNSRHSHHSRHSIHLPSERVNNNNNDINLTKNNNGNDDKDETFYESTLTSEIVNTI